MEQGDILVDIFVRDSIFGEAAVRCETIEAACGHCVRTDLLSNELPVFE